MRLTILCEAVSPITHSKGSEGNESLLNRELITTERGLMAIPILSGNAIRHRAIRKPGARLLIDAMKLDGKLSLPILNFLFHGGNLTDGGGFEDTKAIAECRRLSPFLSLLGGCLPSQILSGTLDCGRGVMVCHETRRMLPECVQEIVPSKLRPAETFVDRYQYTRSDAVKSVPDLVSPDEEIKHSNLMIFAGRSVLPGAWFAIEFVVKQGYEDLHIGALLASLEGWAADGSTIGGMASRGHGRLTPYIVDGPSDTEAAELIAAYRKHLNDNADELRQWLLGQFDNRPTKPEKPAKVTRVPKAKKTDVSAESDPAPLFAEDDLG